MFVVGDFKRARENSTRTDLETLVKTRIVLTFRLSVHGIFIGPTEGAKRTKGTNAIFRIISNPRDVKTNATIPMLRASSNSALRV